MKRIDSDALVLLNRAMGLGGRGSPVTELTDGIVDQTLDVTRIIRRGRTQAGTTGIYIGVLENTHGAANSQSSLVRPYNVAAGAIAPYPVPMPTSFDIWLLGAVLRQISGTGTLSAALTIDYQLAAQGFGVDQAGAAVVSATQETVVAFWDALISEGVTFGITAGGEVPYVRLGIRLPRGLPSLTTGLRFRTTSSAIAVFACFMVIGVFPVTLGQDGIE